MFIYKGFTITYDRNRPVTGTWRAECFGVGMCNSSKESILRMVDTKVWEAVQERQRRQQF